MEHKSPFTFYGILLTFCFYLTSVSPIKAQENGVFEISIENDHSNSIINSENDNNRKHFYDLAFNLHPTHYIEDNQLKSTYDIDEPIKLTFEDIKSLNWLSNKSAKKTSIKLIIIKLNKIEDLNNKIDISDDSDFLNLKYVYIKCTFKCSDSDIVNFIKTNLKTRIFYTNIIGG